MTEFPGLLPFGFSASDKDAPPTSTASNVKSPVATIFRESLHSGRKFITNNNNTCNKKCADHRKRCRNMCSLMTACVALHCFVAGWCFVAYWRIAVVNSFPSKCLHKEETMCNTSNKLSQLYSGCHKNYSLFAHTLDSFDDGKCNGRFIITLLRHGVSNTLYPNKLTIAEGFLFNLSHDVPDCVFYADADTCNRPRGGCGQFANEIGVPYKKGNPRSFFKAYLQSGGVQHAVNPDFYVCTAWMYFRIKSLMIFKSEADLRRNTWNDVVVSRERAGRPIGLFTVGDNSTLVKKYPDIPLYTRFNPATLAL